MDWLFGPSFNVNTLKAQLKASIVRMNLQRNTTTNLLKNQKREVANLLKEGKDESARIKVESIIREEFTLEAYSLLELFVELLTARIQVIQLSKSIPDDLREAIFTINWAAPRSRIKEFTLIKQQLYYKYEKELEECKKHGHLEEFVNPRIKHKLAIPAPEPYIVLQYLNDIAKAHDVAWKAELPASQNAEYLEHLEKADHCNCAPGAPPLTIVQAPVPTIVSQPIVTPVVVPPAVCICGAAQRNGLQPAQFAQPPQFAQPSPQPQYSFTAPPPPGSPALATFQAPPSAPQFVAPPPGSQQAGGPFDPNNAAQNNPATQISFVSPTTQVHIPPQAPSTTSPPSIIAPSSFISDETDAHGSQDSLASLPPVVGNQARPYTPPTDLPDLDDLTSRFEALKKRHQ